MNSKNPKGAGRKPTPANIKKTPVNCRIEAWIIDEMISRGLKKGQTIEDALIKHLKLKKPN